MNARRQDGASSAGVPAGDAACDWRERYLELKESEERFRVMADFLPHIIWVHDETGRQTYVNQTFCDYFGTTREEMRDGRWRLLMHPAEEQHYVAEFEACVRDARPFHATTRVRRADGEWRWLESWARPRFDEANNFRGHVGTSIDVTDRRAEEAQRELLSKELAHRVRNTLSIVSALAHRSFAGVESARSAFGEFSKSIEVLGGCNDILLGTQWRDVELRHLIERSVAFAGESRFVLAGPRIELPPTAALSFALALHELATNALKHGALSAKYGLVTITWEETAGAAKLVWRELNGPQLDPTGRRGFGTRMIKSAVEGELAGNATFEFAPEGLICTLEWPTP